MLITCWRPCRRGEGRSSRRLRGTGGIELDAAIVHQDPEAAMREIRRLRAAQEARRPCVSTCTLPLCPQCWAFICSSIHTCHADSTISLLACSLLVDGHRPPLRVLWRALLGYVVAG